MQAERCPGMRVEGWTDRPTVPPDLLQVWASYCALMSWGNVDLATIGEWVDRHHWREDVGGRAMLFGVFVELVKDRRIALAETEPPKDLASD